MRIPDLNNLIKDLSKIKESIELINKDMEAMRSYYKHQNTELDDASESAIISWQSVREISSVIDSLEEINNYEE